METASVPTGYPDQFEIALLLDLASVVQVPLQAPTETVPQRHCAWCGDPPDAHGSHSICTGHSVQLIEQARVRRNRKAFQEVCHVH